MKSFIILLSLFYCAVSTDALRSPYPKIRTQPVSGGVGKPLFLTPYIETGKIREGQAAAKVKLLGTEVKSYSGFLTVNKTFDSNLFFWFFPSETDSENAPVVLWLQGGPGGSSLYGLFCENGPFLVSAGQVLKPREYYWSQVLNVIYIDNPVGTGFSFTKSDEGYAKDEVSVGKDLYSALSQFFLLFPNLANNDFFVSGESYAGKYLPAIGYTIYTNNKVNQQKINLKGLAIGDGFTDPPNMMVYADYLYQIGLIDLNQRAIMKKLQDDVVEDIQKEDYLQAYNDFDSIMIMVGSHINVYNFISNEDFSPEDNYDIFLQTNSVRKSIHVGDLPYNDGSVVAENLKMDFMKSVKPWVEVLLENYRVLFYNGQLDIIVAYPLTVNFLQKLNWSGAETYKSAPRKQWLVDNQLAGFSKTVKNFTEVLVRDAGHMVPLDQPKWALDLITRFVFNKPF